MCSLGERDQALQESAQLHEFNADLEGYKKTMEQQLEHVDKKIAEQLPTIQKLNWERTLSRVSIAWTVV